MRSDAHRWYKWRAVARSPRRAWQLRPAFAQMMPFAAEIGQGLRVHGVGPQLAGDLLTRDRRRARVERKIREELLLARVQRPGGRPPVDDNAKSPEQFEAHSAGTGHRFREYTRR